MKDSGSCTITSILLQTALALTLLTATNSPLAAQTENNARLADVKVLLTQLDMINGVFQKGHQSIRSIEVKTQLQFGKIEGAINIDTPEEFITASYFSPIEVSRKARAAIDRELPRGPEGAKRLGAMWMKKSADMEISPENAQKAIDIIKSKSNLTDREIIAYYQNSIKREIMMLGGRHLSSLYSREEIKNVLLAPVYDYYINPTNENLSLIAEMAGTSKSPAKYMKVLHGLSSRVASEVNIRI